MPSVALEPDAPGTPRPAETLPSSPELAAKMKLQRLASPAALALLAPAALAQDPVLTHTPANPIPITSQIQVEVQGTAGDLAFYLLGTVSQDFATPFGTLALNPNTALIVGLGPVQNDGTARFLCGPPPCDYAWSQVTWYGQAVTLASPRNVRGISNVDILEIVTEDACPPCVLDAPVDTDIWTCTTYLTAFYMPGCGNERFAWSSPATFSEYADGTAVLTGQIEQTNDSSRGFCVSLTFSGRETLGSNSGTYPPVGSPKFDCIKPEALAELGGPIDTSEWRYYTDIQGTFTGKDANAGLNYDVEIMGPAAQMGFGGSLKNADWGLSAWLLFTRTSGAGCAETIHGDINVNLTGNCP